MSTQLITLSDCRIENQGDTYLSSISWTMNSGETWLITGANGSGKTTFAEALSGKHSIVPNNAGRYTNAFSGSVRFVSFEAAARFLEEERLRDDSDFTEGGVDPGRTPRMLLASTLEKNADGHRFPIAVEEYPSVQFCGIAGILDRGLKYLSTGELRRTLLCLALAENPALLIFDEPFDGLDAGTKDKLAGLLSSMIRTQRASAQKVPGREAHTVNDDIVATTDPFFPEGSIPSMILITDRYDRIPEGITHVLELSNREVAFSGTRTAYEKLRAQRLAAQRDHEGQYADDTEKNISASLRQTDRELPDVDHSEKQIFVEMKHITVEWSERKVLDNLSWTLREGEHWLIRGPNGSGKTTFLELITGDNPQVFKNEVWFFGSKRGSGETIWEVKEKLGIVSYRMHTEYRAFGDMPLAGVVLSGLYNSIGLYQAYGDEELRLAEQWLNLVGFVGRPRELFRDLSYGEQQAVIIARAAIKCPPVLILDEPCHGLDDESRNRILTILQTIAERGSSTLLHVTHDPTEILPCEQHILELRPGETPMYRIIQRG